MIHGLSVRRQCHVNELGGLPDAEKDDRRTEGPRRCVVGAKTAFGAHWADDGSFETSPEEDKLQCECGTFGPVLVIDSRVKCNCRRPLAHTSAEYCSLHSWHFVAVCSMPADQLSDVRSFAHAWMLAKNMQVVKPSV